MMITRLLYLSLWGILGLSCLVNDSTLQVGADTVVVPNNSTSTTANATCETAEARWSDTNVKEVLDAWQFTPEEQARFLELRIRLSDIDHWKNDPAEVARFIKEHNFHVSKAEEMFRGMIAWRLENDIDTFMERYGEPPAIFHYAPLFLLRGLDHDGDPIFVERIGVLDGWGLYQRLGLDAMMDAMRFVSEVHTSREVGIRTEWQWQKGHYERVMGKRVTQFTILIDLEGLGLQLLRPAMFQLLSETARIAQDHYPGLAKRIVMVRAPRLFQMAWKVAVHFYDDRVQDKFIFTTKEDYLDILSKYMDLEVLPDVMYPGGGKGSQMPGFFEKIRMEGGPIPKDMSSSSSSLQQEETNTALLSDLTAASA
ncbi:SEC14-like protein 5 [Seminavis robusta]|uniref:SEC14-like protein 5 n=1 Tax=Seminavis robusta TaxID=568900 RepID=A0A9N8EXJ3_9STRA|nr:SEC14-like protein 5 [Seminavis robusta]|eukprot:Sro2071_g313400.1 SEC14-like protein 5 (368) ;mRNA; r:12556-13659